MSTGHIPNDILGWPDKFQPDDTVEFKAPVDAAAATWWVARFTSGDVTLFPRDVADRLSHGLPGPPTCLYSLISPEMERVAVELHAVDVEDSAQHIWFSGQTLGFVPDRTLFSDLIEVAERHRGKGFGKKIMSNCYDLAVEMDMQSLRLKASWVGAYLWLKFGFIPDRADWEGELKSHITKRLIDIKPYVGSVAINRVFRRLSSPEPTAAWLIADDRTEIHGIGKRGTTVTLGEALLSNCGASWSGTLNLSDEESVWRYHNHERKP